MICVFIICTRRLTESGFMWFYGFMEKPGFEPATPGLQGIALIHYTTGFWIQTDCKGYWFHIVLVCILTLNWHGKLNPKKFEDHKVVWY